MIRFRMGELVGFGLSEMNLQKLREGLPIAFDGKTCGVNGVHFLIMYGETERDIVDSMRRAGLDVPEVKFAPDGSPAPGQSFDERERKA